MLDFTPVRDKTLSIVDLSRDITKSDLYNLTDEMIETILKIIADARDEDVDFVPQDPEANDTFGIPEEKDLAWTLGHVIVHTTASSEESAALALTLARGLPVDGRSRYEVPWRTIHTVAQLHQRLEESRRMRRAMLDAWPDEPHLDTTYTPYPSLGPINAVTRFVTGLSHDDAHLGQLREIMRQAKAARNTAHAAQ
jgi:hypothetical protein